MYQSKIAPLKWNYQQLTSISSKIPHVREGKSKFSQTARTVPNHYVIIREITGNDGLVGLGWIHRLKQHYFPI